MTNDSQLFNKVIRNWLQTASQRQKENFVNIIYEVFRSTEATDTNEICGMVNCKSKI